MEQQEQQLSLPFILYKESVMASAGCWHGAICSLLQTRGPSFASNLDTAFGVSTMQL
jgi:hypothetical protein